MQEKKHNIGILSYLNQVLKFHKTGPMQGLL